VLKQWMDVHEPSVRAFNLVTVGAHGRRSRLLFQEAFGGGMDIGIISTRELRYEGGSWWKSSAGIREIVSETTAYLYARLVFRP
jgi:hypothetical protein